MAADLEQLADEATADPAAPWRVTLVDTELEVIPSTEWRSSAIHAVHVGDFDTWAAACLTPESWEIWQEIDPKPAEVGAFFAEYHRLTRESVGKSTASPRSSRRTARR